MRLLCGHNLYSIQDSIRPFYLRLQGPLQSPLGMRNKLNDWNRGHDSMDQVRLPSDVNDNLGGLLCVEFDCAGKVFRCKGFCSLCFKLKRLDHGKIRIRGDTCSAIVSKSMGGRMRKDVGEKREMVEDRRKVQIIPGETMNYPLWRIVISSSIQQSRGNEFLYQNFRNE